VPGILGSWREDLSGEANRRAGSKPGKKQRVKNAGRGGKRKIRLQGGNVEGEGRVGLGRWGRTFLGD